MRCYTSRSAILHINHILNIILVQLDKTISTRVGCEYTDIMTISLKIYNFCWMHYYRFVVVVQFKPQHQGGTTEYLVLSFTLIKHVHNKMTLKRDMQIFQRNFHKPPHDFSNKHQLINSFCELESPLLYIDSPSGTECSWQFLLSRDVEKQRQLNCTQMVFQQKVWGFAQIKLSLCVMLNTNWHVHKFIFVLCLFKRQRGPPKKIG